MADVVSLDELISDEWYPGFKPSYGHGPSACEPVSTFKKEDEERFWFLDFHWPRGLTPMGTIFLEDGYCWGTQCAAQALPLPPGKGLANRLGGTHVYASEIPVTSPWELGARAARIGKNLPPFLQNFDQIWKERVSELESGLSYFEQFSFDGTNLSDIAQYIRDARTFQRRAWEIHFEMMYPLLANYLGFYGVCTELKIDPGEISKFLQGYDTKILECDRELWLLTAQAKASGIESVFAATEPEQLASTLKRDARASGWMSKFETFLGKYGWRTEGISDIALAPWIEDPTSPLGTIKTFLAKGELHDFEKARIASHEERDTAIDAARSKLTREEQRQFDGALGSCQAANFAWWNDEHNYYIDLRSTIPLRRGCLALSNALGMGESDDTLFLFWPEIAKVYAGEHKWSQYKSIVEQRRQYYDHWAAKRPAMPKMVGAIPEAVTDPILIEIFGMHQHFFKAMKHQGDDVQTLTGVAASAGVVRGRARVLHDAAQLHRILPGEILVCEATSPNWTPAFAKIAACVCDGGGTLTHASIISREYRIPCVVGCGLATSMINDGDEIEVNGTAGTVTILARKS